MKVPKILKTAAFALSLLVSAAPGGARPARAAEDIIFPKDAGIANVRDRGARGDGVHDDTRVIQKALSEHPNQGKIIYLPDGIYLVSDTLRWPRGARDGSEEKNTILQGQSQDGVILKLKDDCRGYQDPSRPKPVLWTGHAPAQRFRNAVRNLTVDTGKNNRGAVGMQFMANNQGCVRDVTIRSGDGQAVAGLDMAYSDEIGPCLIKNVHVIGFDIGIKTAHAVDSQTFEHITLENQNQYGFQNSGQCVSIRDLTSTNAIPAVYNAAGSGLVTLIDATLNGKGSASGQPAIKNEAALYARNVNAAGYQKAVENHGGSGRDAEGPEVKEFVSPAILSLFPSPQRALHLPVKETPEVPWDKPGDWASPTQYGAIPNDDKDDTAAIQAAIDSGKTTVYFPNGSYRIRDTILIRGNVRRIIGCEAHIEVPNMGGKPGFKLVEGNQPVVIFERISSGYSRTPTLENASARTLVVSSCCNVCGNMTGSGEVFLEDVCSNPFTNWIFNGQNVWARQLNVENEGTHVVNNGGTLWMLGYKTERPGTLVETTRGAKTEVVGGFAYATGGPKTAPMFINDESSTSITIGESSFGGHPFNALVRETRNGVTRTLNRADAPARTGGGMLPLYVGYTGEEANK